MPDGNDQRFKIVESPVMAPELTRRFPQIRTYLGQGLDDPAVMVRFDWSPYGFHAQILLPGGTVYIDPMVRGDRQNCVSYYKRDDSDFVCLVDSIAKPSAERLTNFEMLSTYRLAMAATGEYTGFHGSTIVDGMSGITTAMNRVNGIYKVELDVRMVLVANNNMLVYTNRSTDPYTNSNGTTCLGRTTVTLIRSSAARIMISVMYSAPVAEALPGWELSAFRITRHVASPVYPVRPVIRFTWISSHMR